MPGKLPVEYDKQEKAQCFLIVFVITGSEQEGHGDAFQAGITLILFRGPYSVAERRNSEGRASKFGAIGRALRTAVQ